MLTNFWRFVICGANNESSEVCGIIKPGQGVQLNRSQAVNVNKLLTIRYLRPGDCSLRGVVDGGERQNILCVLALNNLRLWTSCSSPTPRLPTPRPWSSTFCSPPPPSPFTRRLGYMTPYNIITTRIRMQPLKEYLFINLKWQRNQRENGTSYQTKTQRVQHRKCTNIHCTIAPD